MSFVNTIKKFHAKCSPFMDVLSFGENGYKIYYKSCLQNFNERNRLKNTNNIQRKIFVWIAVISTVLSHFATGSNALILELCKTPLGMESGDILDEQITASSSYEVSVTGPASARLNVDHLGGAWCPKGMVGEEDAKHFLEINLKKVHVVSAAVTQGRFGNGRGVEYVEFYLLEYWREGFKEWKTYKLYNGSKILKGNTNAYTAVTMELMPPIFASKIRFVPHASHPRTVCMRVEIIGCPYADGVVSYSMPQGEERGQDLELIDANYDGEVKEARLKGGLGQLTDGIIGESNFRANLTRGRGYEWIGWKNESMQHLEVIFQFDSLRNFTAMYIYTNNMFSKDVQVFSRARVWFGSDGSFNPKPTDYFYMKDEASEYSRNVSIVLKGRIARNLKLQLYFSSRWIMISEIYFLSVPVHENGSSINFPLNADVFGLGSNHNRVAGNRDVYNDVSESVHDDFQAPDLRLHKVADSETDEKRQQLIAIIIGILVAVILLLVGAIFYFFWNTKRHKMTCLPQDLFHGPFGHKQEIVRLQIETENDAEVMKNGIYTEPFQATYRGSSFSTATATHRINPSLRMSSPEYTEYASTDYAVPDEFQRKEYGTQRSTSPYFSSFLGKVVPSNESPLHQSLKSCSMSTNNNLHYSRTMQEDDGYERSQINIHINDKSLYGDDFEDDTNKPSIEEVDAGFPPEIPKHKITVIRKLGEGEFGEVHLGEVEDDDSLKRLVAVKSLRMESSFDIRSGFEREVSILARLQNRNIVRVIGVITTEEPLCMLSEYGKRGDLNHFLQGHVASTSSTRATNAKTISYGCLIYMATQIASGMKYLESLNFVHRDLATRNCLVCSDYSIKISDFGMSRQVHRGDYFLTETNILMPVRWMAWESILLGKYTTKSDVWAFGVTLWEVLTMVRERPFEDLTDKEVIDNANYFYQAGQRKETLFQPPNCPKEIYDLMKECWKHSELDRPTFKEIHMFLQRKNLGYSLSL